MPAEPVIVRHPAHPLHALTTYELRDYRQDLECAITGTAPGDPARAGLCRKLDEVLAEQKSRAKVTTGSPP